MSTVSLRETASVVLSAAGAGTAKIGPRSAREVWHPSNATVRASSATKEAQAELFVGFSVYAGASRGTTFSGSSGDTYSGLAGDIVRCGEYVHAVWTGGDAGATATLNVTGTKDV